MADRIEQVAACAADFVRMVQGTAPWVPPEGLLAGPHWTNRRDETVQPPRQLWIGSDNLHFPMNVGLLLRLGFAGIEAEALRGAAHLEGEPAACLRAVATCHGAARAFCRAHAEEATRQSGAAAPDAARRLRLMADACAALAERAPRTFHEAVQLFWFAWCLRGHGTIGRLDQHLFPFYKADREAGRIAPGGALGLLSELWRAFNRPGRGDTLRNVMLGGQDAAGRDATNEVSMLMLDAALAVRDAEPHVNVRLHSATPEAFRQKAIELQLLGHGQGTAYNDEVIIGGLVEAGVAVEKARNYANDGCSEIVIDGDSGIELGMVDVVKSLELALFNGEPPPLPGPAEGKYWHREGGVRALGSRCVPGFRSGDVASMSAFDEVYAAFLRQYLHQTDIQLRALCEHGARMAAEGVTSPFLAGTFPGCLETGADPYRGGVATTCWVFFGGSVPTAADGLAAIRQVVFRDRACSMDELLAALRANFAGHEPLRRKLLTAPKFGNDVDEVDDLAADIARRLCGHVRAHPTPHGKPIWPALFNHLYSDDAKVIGATPDGRRWKDPIAEHFSPTPGCARNGPTAVIRSATKGPLRAACGTSVFNVSLSRSMFPADGRGRVLLRQLLDGALRMGAAVMNVAIYDVAALRDAQAHPERHPDLLVRVWGYSARFVDLAEDQQEHIIARTITESQPGR